MHYLGNDAFNGLRKFLFALFCFYCINANSQTQANIYFESGSDHVAAKDKEILRRLVAGISQKEFAISVHGYTDTIGTAEQNRSLAFRRESAVASILSEYGINSQQIGTSCGSGNLSGEEVSNAENRRVSITIDELIAYPAKNGSVIMAPKHIKLRVIDQYNQPARATNYYRNKKCQLPVPAGNWLTDVAIESATDSCNFIIVKVPDKDNSLPVLFLGEVKYENHGRIGFRSYTTTDGFSLFRVPLYSNYIALDQFKWCGYHPMIYLDIVLPKTIRPLKATLSNYCITLPALFKKDTLRVEYDAYAQINWSILNLTVKTRDTVYRVPMSEFEVVSELKYSGGVYVLRLPADRETTVFREKQVVVLKKRRTFWQRLADLFR